jgi:GT2 family glycosyltransferase
MSDFSVSAIIPTKNRPDDVRLTLRSLLAQSVQALEVIIIDQSDDDRSKVVASEVFRSAGGKGIALPELRYVHDTSIRGVSQARNRALDMAKGAIWLFLDDDVEMDPVFIEELLKVFAVNPAISGVSGVITNYPVPPLSYRSWLWLFARGPFREKRLPVYWDAHKYRKLVPVIGMSGGLMSFRAEIARTGRFDESMTDGEDVDYCVNLKGTPLMVLAPKVRLKHMASNINRIREAWLKKFAASQSHLYHKNWNHKLSNRICFGWFIVGLSLASLLSCVRRLSSEPFVGMLQGLRQGEAAAVASRLHAPALAKSPLN